MRLDASLANEDMLPAGDYPVRLKVVAPDGKVVWERATTIPIAGTDEHPPFAIPVLDEEIKLDGPPGDYQFVASLESGGAARCGNVRLVVMDPADLPAMSAEVVLWGEDPVLAKWLLDHGVKTVPFDANQRGTRQLILASAKAPSPAVRSCSANSRSGWCAAVRWCSSIRPFLPIRHLPVPVLRRNSMCRHTWQIRGAAASRQRHRDASGHRGGYYRACRWAKKHPMFDGLPCGGMMDYLVFRNIISPTALSQDYTVNLGICRGRERLRWTTRLRRSAVRSGRATSMVPACTSVCGISARAGSSSTRCASARTSARIRRRIGCCATCSTTWPAASTSPWPTCPRISTGSSKPSDTSD